MVMINSIECFLISATSHKPSHIARYELPISIRAHTLLTCLERFQYFLEDKNSEGKVIYERFSIKLRKKMNREMQKLQSIPGFPYLTKLDKIKGKIINGDPSKEKMLSFSDFFVYTPHIKMVTRNEKDTRWQEIMDKYYLLYGDWKKRGFVIT